MSRNFSNCISEEREKPGSFISEHLLQASLEVFCAFERRSEKNVPAEKNM